MPRSISSTATSIDATQRKLVVVIVIATLMALAIGIAALANAECQEHVPRSVTRCACGAAVCVAGRGSGQRCGGRPREGGRQTIKIRATLLEEVREGVVVEQVFRLDEPNLNQNRLRASHAAMTPPARVANPLDLAVDP